MEAQSPLGHFLSPWLSGECGQEQHLGLRSHCSVTSGILHPRAVTPKCASLGGLGVHTQECMTGRSRGDRDRANPSRGAVCLMQWPFVKPLLQPRCHEACAIPAGQLLCPAIKAEESFPSPSHYDKTARRGEAQSQFPAHTAMQVCSFPVLHLLFPGTPSWTVVLSAGGNQLGSLGL